MRWDELVELIRTTPAPDEAPSVPNDSLKLPDDDAGDIVILDVVYRNTLLVSCYGFLHVVLHIDNVPII